MIVILSLSRINIFGAVPTNSTIFFFYLGSSYWVVLNFLPDATLSLMVTKAKVNISHKVDTESANTA